MYNKNWYTENIGTSEVLQRTIFSVLSTLVILFFVEIPVKRYSLTLQEGQLMHHSSHAYYLSDDLDSDGNSERVYFFNLIGSERLTIILYDVNGRIMETVNLPQHDWNPNSVPAVYDIDDDGIKEVLLISVRSDSVFLNAINLFTKEFIINHFLIGMIERPVPQLIYSTNFLTFGDLDKNSENEIYFQFDAGYGLKPRGYFRFDVKSRNIYSTPESYIAWLPPVFSDLNNDGIPEILASSYAPSNVQFETEYTDGRSWIGAFDLEMNYLFPPLPMPKGFGYAYTIPATFDDSMFFAIYSCRSSDSIPNNIFLLNISGEIINETNVFQDDPTLFSQKLVIYSNRNYLIINNIGQFELTSDLNYLPQRKLKKQKDYNPYLYLSKWLVDINSDGSTEYCIYNPGTSLFEILNDKYESLSSFLLPFERLKITGIYPFLVNGKIERIMVANDSGYFFMQFTENRFYWLKYLFWVVVLLASWLFIYLIQYFQRRRMEQKWETEKKLTELQFNTIRNQLNPHFIFNALNSVGYMIEKGQKEEAYDFLSVNTRLIRKVLDDADITKRTLQEEINFVKDYLVIQEFRFKDRFKTIFKIDPNVDKQMAVPKMVLHTYVENAIKHGFKNKYSGGILEIEISALPYGMSIIIQDNGIPDPKQVQQKDNTGKGLKIMESYYRLFEKQHQCRIHTEFKNGIDASNAKSGTRVEITIKHH